jgi:hypothetical protein
MDKSDQNIKNYFSAKTRYFWQWTENGEVIEWSNGRTLCYREDLRPLLEGLYEDGLPGFGTILLLMGACQNRFSIEEVNDLFLKIQQLHGIQEDRHAKEVLNDFVVGTMEFLEIIHALPLPLRSGAARIHLIREVIAHARHRESATSSNSLFRLFESGQKDDLFLNDPLPFDLQILTRDLEDLLAGYSAFQTTEELENMLRTGLKNLPPAIDQPLPEVEQDVRPILEQLAEDEHTKGLARLTERIIAAMSIPMQTQSAGNLPLGGVSDITNRGDFDRLLISELANEDDFLLARLANNEALYLRREEPPEKINRQRIVLVDTTLRMWGMPRVFALSSALACGNGGEQDVAEVAAYSLNGQGYDRWNLSEKEGVLSALEELNPAAHCLQALSDFISDRSASENEELFFITNAENLVVKDWERLFYPLQAQLSYLLTVSRTGELRVFQLSNGRRKLLTTAKFDLGQLLFEKGYFSALDKGDFDFPDMIEQRPFPLQLPSVNFKPEAQNAYYIQHKGLIGITKLQSVYLWLQSGFGAREAIPFIEEGEYTFGFDGRSAFYILVSNAEAHILKLYSIFTRNRFTSELDLWEDVGAVKQAFFLEKVFYLDTDRGLGILHPDEGEYQLLGKDAFDTFSEKQKNAVIPFPRQLAYLKRFVNNGYSVKTQARRIFVNYRGNLVLDSWELLFKGGEVLKWEKDLMFSPTARPVEFNREAPAPFNPKVRFKMARWEDGSVAWVDTRGLLYLKSSHPDIPDLCILLLLGKSTSCWAADGNFAGAYNYTQDAEGERLTMNQFIRQYFEPFIKNLGEY